MKIVFTAKGTEWDSMMDPRFGRTQYINIYDEENQEFTSIDNSAVENDAHGAGTATSQKIFDINPDILITGNGPGGNAAQILRQMKMKIFVYSQEMSVKQAYEQLKNGGLKEF